jgi:hypothetical protein
MLSETTTPARRIRLFLRDFRVIEATINVPEGQSLQQYFASRKQYVNLRDAKWSESGEHLGHAVLKIDQVMWAVAIDGDVALSSAAPSATPRAVEAHVDGGLILRAGLYIGDRQRLSDYMESQPHFIPLRNAQLLRSGRRSKEVNIDIGDAVLNQAAVQMVWEIS